MKLKGLKVKAKDAKKYLEDKKKKEKGLKKGYDFVYRKTTTSEWAKAWRVGDKIFTDYNKAIQEQNKTFAKVEPVLF